MSRCLVVVLFLFLSVAYVADANALNNSGFDDPKSSEPPECDQSEGWDRWGSWANRHTNQSSWQARSGLGALAYHHWQSDSVNAGWYQDVSGVETGRVYTFAAWARWTSDCNASNVNVKFEKHGGGGPNYLVQSYTAADIGTNWTRIFVQGTLPAGVTSVRCTIECMHGFGGDTGSSEGYIMFDDASLVSEPGTVILLSQIPFWLVGVALTAPIVGRLRKHCRKPSS